MHDNHIVYNYLVTDKSLHIALFSVLGKYALTPCKCAIPLIKYVVKPCADGEQIDCRNPDMHYFLSE